MSQPDTFEVLLKRWREALKSEGRYWQAADELESLVQRVRELRNLLPCLCFVRKDGKKCVKCGLTALLGKEP